MEDVAKSIFESVVEEVDGHACLWIVTVIDMMESLTVSGKPIPFMHFEEAEEMKKLN